MSGVDVATLRRHVFPGARVAVADGAGAPLGLSDALAEVTTSVGGVSVLLGWCLQLPVDLDGSSFADVRAIVGGYALREPIRRGQVTYAPTRLGALPALLKGPLRADVLLASVRPSGRGFTFTSEVAWMRAAVDAGALVLAEVNHGLPRAASEDGLLTTEQVVVIGETDRPPLELPRAPLDRASRRIGELVAELIPEGASIQVGPGRIGNATVQAIEVPVRVDSGVVTDAVRDLAQRELLLGEASGAYVIGTRELYDWADGRALANALAYTHDLTRLAGRPFVAINTALEVDAVGQVNVEGIDGDIIAGVGGHPDYAAAAASSQGGTSVIALPTVRGGCRTLVDRLSAPVSTSRTDVDVVVTENGVADLRGCSDRERSERLRALWSEEVRSLE